MGVHLYEELHGSEGGDCHSPSSAGWSDSASSILSSAEAYTRKTDSVKGPYNVKVVLSLRVVGGGCGVVASSFNLKRVLLTVPNMSNKRRKYGKDDKMKILEAAATYGPVYAISLAHNMTGYEHVSRRTLRKWKYELYKPKRKMGRPGTDDKFNFALLNELIFTSSDADDGRCHVKANVAFTYGIIRHAAMLLKQTDEFKNHPAVKDKKFTDPWCKTWARNVKLHRRRITTTIKKFPPPEEVEAHMWGIQQHLVDFNLDEIISADETGINYGLLPLYQFIPDDAERAAAPASDEKARITAMLWGTADGQMQTMFLIIKCSLVLANLSNSRVQ